MVRVCVTCTGRLEETHLSPTEENRSVAIITYMVAQLVEHLPREQSVVGSDPT